MKFFQCYAEEYQIFYKNSFLSFDTTIVWISLMYFFIIQIILRHPVIIPKQKISRNFEYFLYLIYNCF